MFRAWYQLIINQYVNVTELIIPLHLSMNFLMILSNDHNFDICGSWHMHD